MYELRQVGANSYYIESPAKIGLYAKDGAAWLIDSGNDKNAGRKIRQILDKHGWSLKAIYNTHSNADHIGGNQFLQQRTGCAVYAPGRECAFTAAPELEPAFLYGAYPPQALRHKFLMAKPSDCRPLTPEVLPEGFSCLPLPGHFFDMVGYRTPDDVVYLADALTSAATIDKYKISFIYDVAAYIDTLSTVMDMEAACFVPAHAEACTDIRPLARHNLQSVFSVRDEILDLCRQPKTFEEILKGLFDRFSLTLDFDQYALAGSTVRSYLSWLLGKEQVTTAFTDNRLYWQSAP